MIPQAIQNARSPDSKRRKWQRLRTESQQSQVTKGLMCPSEEFGAKVKGKHWKALTREVKVLHFRKTSLAPEGTTKEVGQNSTHRHLLQPSSQVVKVASAIAMSHQGGRTDMGAGWLTAVGLEWWGQFVLSESTDLWCLAASSSWPPYHYRWPLTHTEIMQKSRPPSGEDYGAIEGCVIDGWFCLSYRWLVFLE